MRPIVTANPKSLAIGLLWLASHVLAGPAAPRKLSGSHDVSPRKALPELRIMPLGDSITRGNGSPDFNGYRGPLKELLSGSKTDFIGSLHDGTMADNNHEGHSGEYIEPMSGYFTLSTAARPNIILLHAGTNDMDKMVDVGNAPDRLKEVLVKVTVPDDTVTVLVAQIIWANDAAMQSRTDAFNAKIPGIVDSLQSAGLKVHVVDMSNILDGANDLSDKKHPNSSGYKKMAQAWYKGIQEVNDKGWLKDPLEPIGSIGVGLGEHQALDDCDGDNWINEGAVFEKARKWLEIGQVTDLQNASRDKVRLADLNGDGMADYILVDDDGKVQAWLNKGNILDKSTAGKWESLGEVGPEFQNVDGSKIRFADVDGDKRADLIVVYDEGAAKVWKNTGNGKQFQPLDSHWAQGIDGVDGDEVYIADMDGDGLADYCVVYHQGGITWGKNTGNNGKDGKARNFEEQVSLGPGINGVLGNKAHLYDMDGDGKADYVAIFDGGSVRVELNTGNLNSGDAQNWHDLGVVAPGVSGVTGEQIRFADLDGDGNIDFLAVSDDGQIRMWRNIGITNIGESLRFVDLNGDGVDDIVQVGDGGSAQAWINAGSNWQWHELGEIAPGVGVEPHEIAFADVDGDGLGDYLVIYDGGSVKAYLNNGNLPVTRPNENIWQDFIVISNGVGVPGSQIQFADLDGDAKADFLVVGEKGDVTAYLNNGNIPKVRPNDRLWKDPVLVATGVGPGSKIQFADLNGDGRAEYLVVYEHGAVVAYNNTGNIPDAGLDRNWDRIGIVAGGVSPQGMVRFAKLTDSNRADYLSVFEGGGIRGYINQCAGSHVEAGSDQGGDLGGDPGGDPGDGSGKAVTAPPPTDPHLNADSTCNDLELYQLFKGISLSREEWDLTDTDPYFDDYMDDHVGEGALVFDFADIWGVGQSYKSCTTATFCQTVNCKDLDDPNAPGTAQAYNVIVSMSNLNQWFYHAKSALTLTELMFNTLLPNVTKTFWPAEDLNNLAMKEILNAGAVAVGAGVGFLGGPVEGAAGALFGGMAGAINMAQQADDTTFDHFSETSGNAAQFFDSALGVLDTMNDDFMTKGEHVFTKAETGADSDVTVRLDDLFSDGRWLDFRDQPILNTDSDHGPRVTELDFQNWHMSLVMTDLINTAWNKQDVFIISHEMTQDQFDSTEVKANSNDGRLKVYYGGRGFYFQAYRKEGGPVYYAQPPPGWGDLEQFGVTTHDILLSSADSYHADGFQTKLNTNWAEWYALGSRDLSSVGPRNPGMFNIPICQLSNDDVSLDDFFDLLDAPEDRLDIHASVCSCLDKKDPNGRKFIDQLKDGDLDGPDDFDGHCTPG